ncbi:hypothetical protein RclHR1_01580015 [Rhizophagus clarus]|uniref:Uncharacterized protein n=1 Tax=Rhizophagus clarus TaxID=94130 RepID=A0A2Z6QV59_9GLOM|nr:hypothetical protein RclHR1_01580015 [Rhizophagus clarus]GES78639.1 hypothetical protein GLOIN_2v1473755 [Rhizophagus clarus]
MDVIERRRMIIQQCELLLNVILANRTVVFPLPIRSVDDMMRRLSYVNRRNPRNRSVTGRGILKYFVTTQGRNFHPLAIGLVTNSLWEDALSHEKAEYVIMSKDLNRRINRFR